MDPLAKMATRLPSPTYDPKSPGDIAICRVVAPPSPRANFVCLYRMLMGGIFFEKIFSPICICSTSSARHGDHFEECMLWYPPTPPAPPPAHSHNLHLPRAANSCRGDGQQFSMEPIGLHGSPCAAHAVRFGCNGYGATYDGMALVRYDRTSPKCPLHQPCCGIRYGMP